MVGARSWSNKSDAKMNVGVKTPTREHFEKVEILRDDNQTALRAGEFGKECQTLTVRGTLAMPASGSGRTQTGETGDTHEQDDPGGLRSYSDSEDIYDPTHRQQIYSQRKYSFGGQDSFHCRPAAARKRRFSERSGGQLSALPGTRRKSFSSKGITSKEKNALPRKFLLGGNISDPLNLNSLRDEAVNKALNESTPHSSPLPIPTRRQQVNVLIPPNINDPLNLNSGEDISIQLISPKSGGRKKRNKHKNKKRSIDGVNETDDFAASHAENSDTQKPDCYESEPFDPIKEKSIERRESESTADFSTALTIDCQTKTVADKIVSPVAKYISPKLAARKRSSSECRSEDESTLATSHTKRLSTGGESVKSTKSERPSPHRKSRRHSNQPPRFRKTDRKFIYGNYNRYYGYRNPDAEEDHRMKCFNRDWFTGKDVLDIGCNVGHVTLAVAKNYEPRSIVGIDIDPKLISAAKKNIRYYLSRAKGSSDFPMSLSLTHGPIATGNLPTGNTHQPSFPNNVSFVHANYVLDNDELLELQEEEYDVIMALSLTKWIQLNFGDQGIKRTFQRMFRQLRPGGRLILEPQAWASYKKKKKITETIFHNFQHIKLRPEQFTEYLLSREVGFATCEVIDTPFNKSKGFQRAVLLFTKSVTAYNTPKLLESRGASSLDESDTSSSASHDRRFCSCPSTPQTASACSSKVGTPRFEIGSTGVTPCSTCKNTPMHSGLGAAGTPRMDSAEGTPKEEATFNMPVVDSRSSPKPSSVQHRQRLPSGSDKMATPMSDSGAP